MATAMYTKMTSTGSSLIVAPKMISKDLEEKIAASVSKLMSKSDVTKLTTKVVRQVVENELNINLTHHKETIKRIMHHELRKIKVQKVRVP
jgi:hypothetical protein